ncbi:MAG: ABC transporter permease [Lachnospiraceae bacterium]|nr:ABC transporter permease [Lachnospiraceae bacterium]
MNEKSQGKSMHDFLSKNSVQSILAALLCILIGLLVGYIALLIIDASGATAAIITILKNYFTYPSRAAELKYLGNTLVKAAPLLMCALSIQFCYQAGLFNIGAAGQYVAGAGAALYCALSLHMHWSICLLAAIIAGGIFGIIVGVLKSYLNVNEVISGIMLNWIGLYSVNMILAQVKETASPYTVTLASENPGALLPSIGLERLFSNNKYVTIAIPLSIIIAIILKIVLSKTVFGYEIIATGAAREAARYSGMKEKRNIIISLFIGGALAGCGAAFLFLSGYEQWSVTQSSVPSMGFNGIAATFLGGLDPIGTVFASYFIQHITSGGSYLDKNIYPSQISDFISSIIIYLCGFVLFFKMYMNKRLKSKKENAGEGGKR